MTTVRFQRLRQSRIGLRVAVGILGSLIGGHFSGAGMLLGNDDWTRFRGANGSGIAENAHDLPVQWGPKENLAWKVALPGPGSSSPIVVGNRVFVTCWSGYGTEDAGASAPQEKLKRHLVCLDRSTGKVLWEQSEPAVLPEDRYGGMFAEHGYASHTPVSDGQRVFVFFGKSGVLAYDLDGKLLWKVDVGTELDPRQWGSASSPILYQDLVIVLASAESNTLYALRAATGEVAWKSKAPNFSGTWGTPVIVKNGAGKDEIVVGVPGEIWSFDAQTGTFLWFCPMSEENSYCSSVIANGDVVYAIEGRGGSSIAVRAGGKDDVSKSNVIWKGNDRNRIATPLLTDGKLYYLAGRVLTCLDASTGKELYKGRLPAARTANEGAGSDGERRGRGNRGGGGGGGGGQDYGSPVAGDGKLYFVTRSGDMHVVRLGDTFESLAVNRVTDEDEDFSATPALVGKQILVRSNKYLYCISNLKE